ncbi:MAG: response regulator [Armatimonadetes bacterium]|nr:response regulator [Armatimonadota bacterium]MBS1704077.1 response regulator [Armatimonadota bacterium]MBS1725579.1 response regulator [Armatimonadota bacterium]
MGREPKIIDILLVEDNAGDALLVQKAFELGRIANHIFTVPNGEEALKFLKGEGDYAGSPRPDLIILDLNMPIMDGREALGKIKADPDLLSIPIIVMTTSDDERDIMNSYKLHVNCYITKPVQVRDFLEVIKAIDYFWIGVVSLPGND